MAEVYARPLRYNRKLAIGARVYIIGNHPWADCAGTYLGMVYNETLGHWAARVQLDEGIEVRVWQRGQLKQIKGG